MTAFSASWTTDAAVALWPGQTSRPATRIVASIALCMGHLPAKGGISPDEIGPAPSDEWGPGGGMRPAPGPGQPVEALELPASLVEARSCARIAVSTAATDELELTPGSVAVSSA